MSTTAEVGYAELLYLTQPQALTIRTVNPATSTVTVLDLSFTINVNLVAGDLLLLTFPVANLQTILFEPDLEGVTSTLLSKVIDCAEYSTMTVISDSRIACELVLGKRDTSPPQHAVLRIRIAKAINGQASAVAARLLISNVKNPPTTVAAGIELTITRACRNRLGQDCIMYRAVGYYSPVAITPADQTGGTLTSSSSVTLQTGLTHTFSVTLPATLNSGDGLLITYPDNFNGVMPSSCSITTHICNVFPTKNMVSIILAGSVSAGSQSFAISGMSNPVSASSSVSSVLTLKAYRAGAAAYHFLPTVAAFDIVGLTSGTSLTLTISQASFFLNNYLNIVTMRATGLYVYSQIKTFFVLPPAQVQSWDTTFCNATLELPTASRSPYSLRLQCSFDGTKILATVPSGTVYQAAYSGYALVIEAKMLLTGSSTTSSDFYVYGSTSASDSSSSFYVSVCKNTIPISPLQVPLFGIVSFNTLPFLTRVARTNSNSTLTLLV
jgi:hypothetical protein